MNPEVVDAIAALEAKGLLTDAQRQAVLPAADGSLVSVRAEIRTVLYAGVALAVSGVGLFLKENQDRIGPAAITAILTLCAASCFLFVARRSPPFTWASSPSPHVAADYVLLLGVLLAGSDLAYIETQFRVLGPDWAYHLLVLSLLAAGAAFRFDSRVVLSLALSSFAAWRGLSARAPFEAVLRDHSAALRANAIGCGLLFLAAGWLCVRLNRKAHFEGVFTAFGWLLFFGGLLSGAFGGDETNWAVWALAALAAAAAVGAFAFRRRRAFDFGVAVVAGYLAILRGLFAAAPHDQTYFFLVAGSSVAVLFGLVAAYRAMRRPA